MTDIKIRKAKKTDFEEIIRLIKGFSEFIGTPEKVKITACDMKSELFHCLVAENNQGVIIGYVTYFFAFYSWIGKSLYLDYLYVIDSFRGCKVGSKLLDEVIEIALTSDCKKVRWQVSNWNTKAIEFYKKRGANIDTTEINCDLIL